jgi:hypothetical protein
MVTIVNSGADTFVSDGTQNPTFNKNFIAGLSKATVVSNPLTAALDSVLIMDNAQRAVVVAYDNIDTINGSTPAALGLTTAQEVATYLNNNFFEFSGGGGGSLPVGTIDKQNLQWNNTLGAWVLNPNVLLGYDSLTPNLTGRITGNYGFFEYNNNGYRKTTYPYIGGGLAAPAYWSEDTIDRDVITSDTAIRRAVEFVTLGTPQNLGLQGTYALRNTYVPANGNRTYWEKATAEGYVRIIENEAGSITQLEQDHEKYVFNAPFVNMFVGYDSISGYEKFEIIGQTIAAWNVTFDPNQFQILTNGGNNVLESNNSYIDITNPSGSFKFGDLSLTLPGYGAFLQSNSSFVFIQGVLNDTNTAGGIISTNAAVSIASASVIDLDPTTGQQTYNTVILGGTGQNAKLPNTAYASQVATRSKVGDFGGAGFTLDADNDPIGLLVADVTGQADFFYIPEASERYLDLEIIVKKIGNNDLTIDDGGFGTVEQVGGGFGNTFVLGGINSAVTIKCIYTGVNYYWIVY